MEKINKKEDLKNLVDKKKDKINSIVNSRPGVDPLGNKSEGNSWKKWKEWRRATILDKPK